RSPDTTEPRDWRKSRSASTTVVRRWTLILLNGLEQCFDLLFDLADQKRLALQLAQADRIDQKRGAQHLAELAGVQLRHQNLAIIAQHVANVLRQRMQVTQVGRRHRKPLALATLDGGADCSARAAPAEDEHVALRRTLYVQRRNLVGHERDLANS